MKAVLLTTALISGVFAQQSAWGQCGGEGWTGPTACESGSCCTHSNDWYSQCIPGDDCSGPTSAPTTTAPTPTSSPAGTTLTTSTTTATAADGSFTNPVLYEDFPDNDISRVGNAYYFTASNMHFSPGAPILRSYDLVNWEMIGHALPTLDFGPDYDLDGDSQAYRRGDWASTLRYRESNDQWYWIGCIDFWNTYIYTADDASGPWTQSAQLPGNCYYDCGLLIDDDDTMYVVHGSDDVNVSQLADDGLSEVRSEPVFSASDADRAGIEGNRMYKKDGQYYILDDDSQGTTVIWKSDSPFGPYEPKIMVDNVGSPVPGASTLDQGSLIETQDGDWYFMSFAWAYPSGRLPVLAPVTWGSDGYPVLTTDSSGAWGASYPMPLAAQTMGSWTGTDDFQGTSLSPVWEWNHNPDTSSYSVNDGLTLSTATVTDDLFHARNTLVHRVHGEYPVGTVEIDFSNMADGDVAGLAAFRDTTSWIGVSRDGDSYTLEMRADATQDVSDWSTSSTGTTMETADITGTSIWFRCNMDARADGSGTAQFYYSTDGSSFTQLGGDGTLSFGWDLFVGYRFGIFNFATQSLGGSVAVSSFTSE